MGGGARGGGFCVEWGSKPLHLEGKLTDYTYIRITAGGDIPSLYLIQSLESRRSPQLQAYLFLS